jgi:hypothetical protein
MMHAALIGAEQRFLYRNCIVAVDPTSAHYTQLQRSGNHCSQMSHICTAVAISRTRVVNVKFTHFKQ